MCDTGICIICWPEEPPKEDDTREKRIADLKKDLRSLNVR